MDNSYHGGQGKKHEEIVPDKWQRDSDGRKFRWVGNTKEYAPTLVTTCETFYADEAPEALKHINEAKQQIKYATSSQSGKGECPFKYLKNSMDASCKSDCVLFEGGCLLARTDRKPTKDTKNKYCPIARTCHETCALYHNGCILTGILQGIQPGKE